MLEECVAIEPPVETTDPVCGMRVEPARARYTAEHAGVTYYFCTARYRERLEAEPEDFGAQIRWLMRIASWGCSQAARRDTGTPRRVIRFSTA